MKWVTQILFSQGIDIKNKFSEANLREEINRDAISKRLHINIEDKNKPLLHYILIQA